MPKKKRAILQPTYMSTFRCIGGACEDNCCVGTWNIFVDKKTFLKYRDVKDPELQPTIDSVIKRYRGKEANDQQYGIFRLRADGQGCVFLTPQKFCHLHSKLGYENLCDVCAVYPRIYKMADGKLERCATMSCPEVVREALPNPDGIAFETVEEGGSVGRVPARVQAIDSRLAKFAAKPHKFFWDIRMFCLSLLQNRVYSLGQRIIILGMVYQKIDELDKAGRVEEIPGMLVKFGTSIEDGALKPELDKVENNFQIQMRLGKELTDNRLSMELVGSHIYLDCVKETLVGLDFFVDTPAVEMLKKYVDNHNTYVAAYLREKEYILENFVVNEFFMRMMPFGSGETVWDSYLYLCVLYGMVKLHLNGMAGCHKGLTDEVVFKLIQSFSKVVLHNGKFIPNMIALLKSCGYDSLAWMTILVND
jgi:lysine-N-methylase